MYLSCGFKYRVKRQIVALENPQHGLVTEMQHEDADGKRSNIQLLEVPYLFIGVPRLSTHLTRMHSHLLNV